MNYELAKKLKKRNPFDPPKIGDRLGFVIIRGNQLLSKRAEDPEYVKKNNIQVDSDYYIQSQLFPPIERIFNSLGIEKSELLGGGRQTKLVELLGIRQNREQKKEQPLQGYDEFVCGSCNKTYARMPLSGFCACGGEILIGFQGSVGKTVRL